MFPSSAARYARRSVLASMVALTMFGCTTSDQPADLVVDVPTASPEVVVTQQEPRTISLGVAAGRRTGQTPIEALIGTEQVAGRRFDTLRAYVFWDSEFPDLRHEWASDDGRMLHLSINARRTDGTVVPWSQIAAAAPGDPIFDELTAWVDRLGEYDAPLRVTFHHEADIEPEFGTPDDFVAAWQHFSTLLDDAAPDIETVWVVTAFSMAQQTATPFWPGDDHVDIIGADAFNWFGCRGNPEAWRSPEEVLAPLMAFAEDHPGKPLVLAELGSDEDDNDPGRKAAWFNELVELVASDAYERLDTIVFFHNDHDAESNCDWWLDSSDPAAEAFEQLASTPLFRGDQAPVTPALCPVVATVSASVDDLAIVDGDGDGRFDFEFGGENRFLGVGDQSNDGADHRLLLSFPTLGSVPAEATLELRLRVGERQPSLPSPIELRLLGELASMGEAFSEPGELLEPALFDSASLGGHHVFDLTGRVDPMQPTTLRLQFATPPEAADGQTVLYLGTANANRSIDRPTLLARLCE